MRSMQEFIYGWVGLCTNVFIFVTEKSITFNLSLLSKYFKFKCISATLTVVSPLFPV